MASGSKVEAKIQRIQTILTAKGHAAILDRVYPRFATHTQDNARWSTTKPPMATLPDDLRYLYMPDPDWPWFGWDWDQQELRIIAALAKDKPLLDIFRNGWDVHTLNCCDIFGIPYPPNKKDPHGSGECRGWRERYGWKGKDDLRRVFAKRFVYRLNYGGDPRTAGDIPGARTLGLTPTRLVAASRAFLGAHPALAAWRRRIESETLRTKCVRSFVGRRRMLHGQGKPIIRAAYDYPMQAGGVEMYNLTIIAIVQKFGSKVQFKYGMHDSQAWGIHRPIFHMDTFLGIREIVERKWTINGEDIIIPGSFYTRDGAGDKVKIIWPS